MRAARNIAIIALLALVVAAVPGGGNLADGFLAVLLIAFLVILGAAGCTTDPEVKKQQYAERGRDYLSEGKHNEAIIELKAMRLAA